MSISEFIGLITIVIGIQGLLMFFYTKGVDRIVSEQKLAFEKAVRNTNHIKNFHETLIVNLQESSATQRMFGSLIQRIANKIDLKIKEDISNEIGRYDFYVEKSLHELCLFSADKNRRNSSIRALAEDYGDLETLDVMRLCKKEFLEEDDLDISEGIKDLKSRISRTLNSD